MILSMIVLAFVVVSIIKLFSSARTILDFVFRPDYRHSISTKNTVNRAHSFYRNCEKPTTESVTGEIEGTIPNWIEGTLIRNGAGILKIGDDVYNHFFDGLAVLHRYHISNGKTTYTSRALESDTYRKNMTANRIIVNEFGTSAFPDPCKTLFQKEETLFEISLWNIYVMNEQSLQDINMGHIEAGEPLPKKKVKYDRFHKRLMSLVEVYQTGDDVVAYLAGLAHNIYVSNSLLQSSFEFLKGTNVPMTDNCSVSVGYYGDQLYAMTETNAIRRINPEDLKTIGCGTVISNYVAINHATAHPHILEDGTVLNMGTSYPHFKGPQYVVVKIPPTFGREETSYEGAEIIAEIPFTNKRYPAYYHSFGITKDKIIFIESPLRLDLLKLATTLITKKTFLSAISWDPSLKTIFHVASMTDGRIHPVTYESDAFFAFHHINAYEEDGQIIVDVAAYDRGDVVTNLEKFKIHCDVNTASEASAQRFVLPLKVDKAEIGQNLVTLKDCKATATLQDNSSTKPKVFLKPQHLTNEWVELPRINYHRNAVKYNYFYSISNLYETSWTTPEPDSLTKVDIKNNKSICWSSDDQVPSEPVFVARPGAIEEDDGVVLSALMEKNEENRVTLLVLNAKNMSELARVKFQTEGVFTSTSHGQWANQTDKIHLF